MKKFLSLVLALVMTMSLVTISAGAKDFTDDSKITYSEAVAVVSELGIVDGYTDGSYNPSATLTRGAAAKIICNLILGPTTAGALTADSAPYVDVPTSNTFAGYIAYCQQQGIISGYADGTFRPAGTLTGYAFMKMLLGALGYDADIEGFVGANWSVQVAKTAIGAGLDDGNDDFVGTKPVTREEAALYALNTLTAAVVDYADRGSSINVGGVEIVTKPSKAEKTDDNNGKLDDVGDGDYLQFGEKYFTSLKAVDTGKDDFGRPATKWTLKSKEIGTFSKIPELTYTKAVKGDDIFTDLGEPELDANNRATTYTDGKSHNDYFTLEDNTSKIGGKGTLTEVYTKDNGTTVDVTIVVINSYAAQVDGVTEAKGNDDRYVSVSDLSTAMPAGTDYDFETEDFEEGDIVIVTIADEEIQTMTLAESVKNVDIDEVNKTDKKVTSADATYELGAKAVIGDFAYDTTMDLYVDEYGYVVYGEVAEEAEAQYALVYALGNANWSTIDDDDEFPVRMLMADGTKVSADATASQADLGTITGTINQNKSVLVSYTYDKKDECYDLTVVADNSTKTADFNQGEAKIVTNNGTIYANSKTVFFYEDASDATDIDVTVGYKSMFSFEKVSQNVGVSIVVAKDNNSNYAKAIFVKANYTKSSSNDDLTFVVISKAGKVIDANNDYYRLNAVVDKEVTTIKADVNGTTLNVTNLTGNEKFALLTSVTYNSKDIATSVVKAGDENNVVTVTKAYSSSKDVIILGGIGYAVADDAVFFTVDEDGVIESAKISKLSLGQKVIFNTNDDGQIDFAVVVTDLL